MKKTLNLKRAIFQVCRFILLVLVCALFNKSYFFLPAFLLLTANIVYLSLRLKQEGLWHRGFTLLQLFLSLNLNAMLMTDSMTDTARFIERVHWTFLGFDATAVLWAAFWLTYLVLAVIDMKRYMSIVCRIIGHKWDGCKCERCGEVRDEGHDFGYTCKCSICGKTGDHFHHFGGTCRCTDCGKTKDEDHVFINGKCLRCGKKEKNR